MSRAYNHPLMKIPKYQLGCPPKQHLGAGLGWDLWEEFREETLDPWVDDTLTSVGMSQEDIDKLKADAGDAFDDQLQKEQQNLMASITGSGGSGGSTAPATVSPPVTQQITAAIADIEQTDFVKGIPGGIYTIAGATAVILIGIVWATRR